LQASVPGGFTLEHYLIKPLSGRKRHLNACARGDAFPGGPAGGVAIVEGERHFPSIGPGAEPPRRGTRQFPTLEAHAHLRHSPEISPGGDIQNADSAGSYGQKLKALSERRLVGLRGPKDVVRQVAQGGLVGHDDVAVDVGFGRSEEHTSELQSLTNLVCRLL